MRVAVLLEQLLGRVPGGTGRYTRELAAALAATADPADSLTGWTALHRDTAAARVDGVRGPHRLPLPAPALNRCYALGTGPTPRGSDVVLAPTLLAPPRRGRPLVVTVHDAVPWTHPETMTAHSRDWHRTTAARVARSADAVLVPTQAVATALVAHLPLDPARLHVTGEGASAAVTVLPPDADARAARLALPPRYLLTVATLEPRKGLDVALRAMADPVLRAQELPLLVVGQAGWGGVDPLAEATALGLPRGRVRVLGRIGDPDLAVALARAAALLVPSRSEGFGLPVVEAMAHGTPVVVSDAPALVEVAGGAALVVPVGDAHALAVAAARAAGNPDRGAGAGGPARAAEHTWTAAARRTWDILRAVTDERRA